MGDIVVDSKTDVEVRATMPNNEITFDLNTDVKSDSNASIVLDFIADQSLHVTTTGEFVFAPVVEVTANSEADVEVDNSDTMTVRAGSANNVESRTSIGVDLDGLTKTNYRLNSSAGLEVVDSNRGNMTFKLGVRTIKTDTNVNSGLNVDSSTDNSANVNVGDNAELNNDTNTDANLDVNSSLNNQTSGSSNSGSSSTSGSSNVDTDANAGSSTNVNVGL